MGGFSGLGVWTGVSGNICIGRRKFDTQYVHEEQPLAFEGLDLGFIELQTYRPIWLIIAGRQSELNTTI